MRCGIKKTSDLIFRLKCNKKKIFFFNEKMSLEGRWADVKFDFASIIQRH